jgi:alcohol dehydrogenase class IV
MATNVSALQKRLPESPALARYDELARIVLDDHRALAADGIQWVQNLCDQLAMPSLSAYDITEKDIPDIISKSQSASSMRGNPIELTESELQDILEQAIY